MSKTVTTFELALDTTDVTDIPVVIIEDHDDLRRSLALILKSTPGFACIGSYRRCEDFFPDIDTTHPAVILMDIGLPGMSGIEGVRRIKAGHPDIHVLMLTIYEDDERVFQAVCAGANGYLLKRSSPIEILQAIRTVSEGGVPMSSTVARRVLEMFRDFAPAPKECDNLTPRESEILRSLIDGLDYKQIAERHFISVETVRNHIRHIYEKLHVHSKSGAVSKALKQRLV